jgi:glutamate transport system substrate-binding protein
MVVSTYSITDAHIQNGIIFAGPYIRTDQGIMVNQDNTTITSTSSLENQTICVTTGSTTALKLEEFKRNLPVIITYRDTLAQCVDDMKNKTNNVAAVTSDAVILQGYAHSDETLKYIPGLTIPGAYEKYGIGISSKNPELCKQTASLLKDFVSTQWNSAFTANLQTDSSLAKSLKPDLNSMDSESCKTT